MEIKIIIIIILISFKIMNSILIYQSNCSLNSSVTGTLKFKDKIGNLNNSLISYDSFDLSQVLSIYKMNSTLFIYNIHQLRKYNYFKINLHRNDFFFEYSCYQFNETNFNINKNKNINIISSIIDNRFLFFVFENFTLSNEQILNCIIIEEKNLNYNNLNQFKISNLINSKKKIFEKNFDYIENNNIYTDFPINLIKQKMNYSIILLLIFNNCKYIKVLNYYEFSFNTTITEISGTSEENYFRYSIYLYIYFFISIFSLIGIGIYIKRLKKEDKLKKKYIFQHIKSHKL